ncbi:MAG: transposase [Persephonella sp.]|nr:transposase [Persephonella sp.]
MLISDMYSVDISPSLISKITDRLLPKIEEWQNRPLDRIYPVIYTDSIFYKVRQDGKVIQKAVNVVIGINKDGYKELLGFWLKVLNDLKSRGVEDVLIFSVDGLAGISKAINNVYPQADIQRCIVHQVRNSLKYVPWKERKQVAEDLKEVYQASTIEEAKVRLDEFEEKWSRKPIAGWGRIYGQLSILFEGQDLGCGKIYTVRWTVPVITD